MPEGAVYVGRPTKWGNPFRAQAVGAKACLRLYRLYVTGKLSRSKIERVVNGRVMPGQSDVAILRLLLVASVLRHKLTELRGKDLACFCPLVDKQGKPVPCHADVLLEMANK